MGSEGNGDEENGCLGRRSKGERWMSRTSCMERNGNMDVDKNRMKWG